MKYFHILLMVVTFSGCDKHGSVTIPPEDVLSVPARAELKLPPEGKITLVTKADIEFVAKLNPETLKAVARCLKPTQRKYSISAARPVGNYLLLYIQFPGVADGGIDLIWSVEKQKPVGTFVGGYRG